MDPRSEVRSSTITIGNEPLYLTLPGAEGLDIDLLISEGVLSLTEVNSIAEQDQGKVVAIENNNQAILALQKKFIGLRIIEAPFQNLIRGEEQFSWPQGDDESICRARVVNLDMNAPLWAERRKGEIIFPVLAWIRKLCQLHARHPKIDWTLCLTLHGEVIWPEYVNEYARLFLGENLGREADFAESCEDFLGSELYEYVNNVEPANYSELDRVDQQKIIMIMVPKIISRLVHNEGWKIHTERNLRYGGGAKAPMVTLIVRFTWDDNAAATPDKIYREALRDIFSGAGIITEDGQIVENA